MNIFLKSVFDRDRTGVIMPWPGVKLTPATFTGLVGSGMVGKVLSAQSWPDFCFVLLCVCVCVTNNSLREKHEECGFA